MKLDPGDPLIYCSSVQESVGGGGGERSERKVGRQREEGGREGSRREGKEWDEAEAEEETEMEGRGRGERESCSAPPCSPGLGSSIFLPCSPSPCVSSSSF